MKKITLIFLLVTSFTLTASAFSFPTNLKLGSRGEEVKNLQILLNQDKDTQIATSGAGSPNNETTYFGPATKRAVINFQNKYKAETLNPIGLTKGTGFVGALTRKKLSTMGTSGTTVTTTTPTTTCLTKYDPKTGKLCVTTTSTAVQTCLTKYDPKTGKLCSQITGTSSSSVTPSSITSNIISPTPAYSFSGGGGGGGYTTPSTSQTQTTTPTNGGWSAYGTCSATACGTTGNRVRTCNNPTPLNGGAYCSGTSSETCSAPACGVNTYTLTATAGANGVISPLGGTTVSQGGSQTYTITPNTGYQLATLTIGGGPVSPVSSYTFTNVQGDNTINATFSAVPASVFATCGSVTYPAPSGATSTIVFTFDKAYQCGQFANGDWWVSPDSAGGTVRVVSITPDGIVGKHGVEINPSSTTTQAFDNASDAPYNASLLATFPRDVSGVSSIVKTVSVLIKPSRPELQFAGVLTVLDIPLANSNQYFRPAYFGTTKTLYPMSDVDLTVLPKLSANEINVWGKPSILPSTINTGAMNLLDRYTGVRLDHIGSWTGRDIHPKDNMPDYGAQIANDNAVYLLRMTINDFDPTSNSQHKLALINYLQMSIDLQAMAVSGTKWDATGGHSIGRKLPLAFATRAFTNPSIKAAFLSAISTSSFDEDNLLYRSTVNGKVLYGQSGTDSRYWQSTLNGYITGAKDVRDPYGFIDGGGGLVGNKGYQFSTAPSFKHTALAIYILNLQSEFNSPNMLEYAERWVNWGVITLPDPCAPFDDVTAVHPLLPTNYNVTYGSVSPGVTPYSCIPGAGRWPLRDGAEKNSGYYGNSYGDNLWNWYKAQSDAISVPYTH